MNNDELAVSIERSVAQRVAGIAPRPDAQELLTRLERRNVRQRRRLTAAAALFLVVGGVVGYVVGNSGGDSGSQTAVAAVSDGTPPSTAPDALNVAPADPDAARAEIAQAFSDAFDGATPAAVKDLALQDGTALRQLRSDVLAYAQAHGYTNEQLAGTTITVLDSNFIDETHAAVHFTLMVPGRGNVIVDKVGYAVYDSGRWKVALRTACDLLSLDGFIGPRPPAP
jgi:hypothetical protein